jgi:hypothetical protein
MTSDCHLQAEVQGQGRQEEQEGQDAPQAQHLHRETYGSSQVLR